MTTVLAVADTDSYLKWSAATLATLPADWSATQLLVTNPALPSAEQIASATPRPVEVVTRHQLAQRVRELRPEVVLLACTGPVVKDLAGHRLFRSRRRPVLVTGLPGISVPASRRAVAFRAACDLFLLHSHREVAEFTAIARDLDTSVEFGLARLPFLPLPGAAEVAAAHRRDVVFAPQAKVPPEPEQREQILAGLAGCGDGVVKLRALAAEQQTHAELWPYPDLYHRLVAERRVPAGSVRFAAGSMSNALGRARGLVTVSSTAALEAMAAGVPLLVLEDFGISGELINVVFEGSGCLGTLEDLAAGRFSVPDPAWLRANYFHPSSDDDWLDRLRLLLSQRTPTGLPPLRRPTGSVRAGLRRRLRLLVPAPAWPLLRRVRRQLWLPAAGAGRGRTAPGRPPDLRAGTVSAVLRVVPPGGRRPRRPANRPAPSPPDR
jgi:hypothetical protein